MAEKNYTAAQTVELVSAYEAAETPESRDAVIAEFAEKFGKTVPSIRAKLVTEGVYVKKEYKTKKGEKPESKESVVTDIARVLGVHSETVESLAKANKATLVLVRGTLIAAAQTIKTLQNEVNS